MSKDYIWVFFGDSEYASLSLMRMPCDDFDTYEVSDVLDNLNYDLDGVHFAFNKSPALAWNEIRDLNRESWSDDGTPWDFDWSYVVNNVYIIDEEDNHINDKIKEEYKVDMAKKTKDKKTKDKKTKDNSGLKKSASVIAKALSKGAALSVTEKTNDVVYGKIADLVSTHLGVDRSKLNEPMVKETILTVAPILLYPAAVAMEGDVPYANWAKKYAKNSITISGKKNSDAVLKLFGDLFKIVYEAQQPTTAKQNFRFETDYNSLTKVKLKGIATEKGVRVASSANKDDIIEALQEYELVEAGLQSKAKQNVATI